MFDRDFEADVKINRYKLEEVAEESSTIYLYWSEQAAEKRAELSKVKERIALMEAETDSQIRATADKKPTEAEIKNRVLSNPEIQKQKEKQIALQKEYDILTGVLRALEFKKSSIEDLVRLYLAGYYSDPKRTPSNGTGAIETLAEAQSQQLRRRNNNNQGTDNV